MVEDDNNELIETRLALYGIYGVYYPPQDTWRLYNSYHKLQQHIIPMSNK